MDRLLNNLIHDIEEHEYQEHEARKHVHQCIVKLNNMLNGGAQRIGVFEMLRDLHRIENDLKRPF